jgi:hypothetical protein
MGHAGPLGVRPRGRCLSRRPGARRASGVTSWRGIKVARYRRVASYQRATSHSPLGDVPFTSHRIANPPDDTPTLEICRVLNLWFRVRLGRGFDG